MVTTINPSDQTITQYTVQVGGASNLLASVGPGSAGQMLQSAGNASNPAYSTATYPATAGSLGNVLTSNGTNFVSQGGGWTLIQTQTVSGSPASINFTTLSSNYNVFVLVINNFVKSATASNFTYLQFSSDGGANYISSGYQSGLFVNAYNSGVVNNVNDTAGILLDNQQGGGTSVLCETVWIYNMNISQIPQVYGTYVGNAPAASPFIGWLGGAYQTATAMNALRVNVAAGTMTSGNISLYGISK